jgi:DNA-binding LacI/PurR family transcriptional regulator
MVGHPQQEPARREPTMGDIAAQLGVSRQLVSLVLRGAPGASPQTRQRVQAAAARLGYRPHIGARTLRQSVNRHVGVAFTPTHLPEVDIVESVYVHAERQGYHVILGAQTPTRSTEQAVEELLGYRCAALIVIGAQIGPERFADLARACPVPVVTVGAGERNRHVDVVRSAGDVGMGQAVHHLAALGHRDIAYLNPQTMRPAPLRLAGYLSATAELGLTQQVITMTGDYTEECGSAAARRLLTDGSLPTAIAAGNDQAALGLLLELARNGVRVPQDVSVTGYDDARVAGLSSVGLTTLRQDPDVMGAAAVAAAVRRIDRPGSRPGESVVQPTLVIRTSTAAPSRRRRSGRLVESC